MKLRKSTPPSLNLNQQSRRMFLKSAGGFSLAIPFLPSLLTAGAERAMADSGAPLRYVSLLTPIGGLFNANWSGTRIPANPLALYPGHTGATDSLTTMVSNGGLSPVLDSSFANLWQSTNLIMGNDQPYYVGHNRSVGNGTFARGVPGQPPPQDQANFAAPGFLGIEYPSMDQLIGGHQGVYGTTLGGRRRFVNVDASSRDNAWGREDLDDPNEPVTFRDEITSNAGLFSYLFGAMPQGSGANPIANLINTFWPSGRALMSVLSSGDRQALDQWFSIASQTAADYSGGGPVFNGVTRPANINTQYYQDSTGSLQSLADILALAFKCDVTRVATISLGVTPNGMDQAQWHAFSHTLPTDPAFQTAQTGIVQIHNNIAKSFYARLATNLQVADPFDGSSTILHNSLMVWTHENKAAHDNFTTPTLLIGEAGGRINTNQFVDLRNKNVSFGPDTIGDEIFKGDLINRFYASIFYAMNVPRSSYETTRGGITNDTIQVSKGYGYILRDGMNRINQYNLDKIGEPWEFLVKPGVVWKA